jgi:hypothetical protein
VPPDIAKIGDDIRRNEKEVSKLCELLELGHTKTKEISELYLQLIEDPTFTKPDDKVMPQQLQVASQQKKS